MIQIGDIYSFDLGREDNITPKDGYDTRKKYCVVVGTPDYGYYVAYLIVDHEINRKFNTTKEQIDNFYPLSNKDYPSIIKAEYDPSWLDLTEFREMETERMLQYGNFLCRLTRRDLELVLETLKNSILLSPKQKKRLGLN